MISFTWAKPTSVLESLVVVGTLVRIDEMVVSVRVEDSDRSKTPVRVIEALESAGKLHRVEKSDVVRVLRGEIADIVPFPGI